MTTSPYASRPYSGHLNINRTLGNFHIETDRCAFWPITEGDKTYAETLLGFEGTAAKVGDWVSRWRANDYVSAFCIYQANPDTCAPALNERVGITSFEPTSHPGTAQFEITIDPAQRNQGFGKEITYAMFQAWAPRIMQHGNEIHGRVFDRITATVPRGNYAAKIFYQMGLDIVHPEDLHHIHFITTVASMQAQRLMLMHELV